MLSAFGMGIIAVLAYLFIRPLWIKFKGKRGLKLVDEMSERSLKFFPDSDYLQKKGMLYFYAFLYKEFHDQYEKDKEKYLVVHTIIDSAFEKSLTVRGELSDKDELLKLIGFISTNIEIPKLRMDRFGRPEMTLLHIVGKRYPTLSMEDLNNAANKFQHDDVYAVSNKLYEFIL